MINSALSGALMPRPVTATANKSPAIGYVFAVHQLALSELTANHFIGAIIDKDTGAVLEYRHLVENPTTKSVWETRFVNKIRCLFQGIRDLQGMKMCFFIQKLQVPTNKQPTYSRIICIFAPKRRNRIAPA
jgi:hypothetical protein